MFCKYNLRLTIIFSIVVVAVPLFTTAVHAQVGEISTMTLTVTARVKGYCAISQPAPELQFGNQDGISGPETITRETALVFSCTSEIPFTITVGNGNYYGSGRRMKHKSKEDLIPYDLSVSPASGMGQGTSIEITSTLTGTIQKAALKNISVGDYDDAVIITIDAR
jgi:spore coat protein U-like protein